MKSRTMKFTLDCSKVGNQLCIDGIRQGDANSIVFIISLANGINLLDVVAGKEESVVVTMYGKKPDGTTIVRDCGINEDGNITYTIHTQDTTCVGIVSYQLVVTSTREKILASPVFSTMVEERNLFKTYTVLTTQPDDWVDSYDKYYYYENGRFYKLNRFESESAPEWVINKYYSVNDNEVESTSDFDALAYALLRAKQYSDKSEEYLAEVKKKADKATTLAGYGITDAYTREGTDKKLARKLDSMPFDSEPKYNSPCYLTSGTVYNSINKLKRYLINLGLQVFESYPYQWMYAVKDIRVTDGSTIAIGYVKRTPTRNNIVLYLVENGALSAAKLYANVDSDITGYATYSNLNKTITMTVNWDEIPYNTDVQFGKNYVLCSEWCYGSTRLEYLLNKVKEEAVSYAENKTSSFESTGKADKIVSNVQIIGMNHTDARLLISNFNRHFNGDDTNLLYIYTTDDTGETANLIKGVRVAEKTGTATVDLSEIVSGATMRFDYDFSMIADGTRLQGTGTGFLIKKNCYNLESVSKSDFENYEEKIPIDFGFFEKFAIVGDSYASGEIYVADSSQSKGYTVADYYQKSWGQILARKHGATCINLSVGGLTTRTWLTNSHGLAKMLAEKPQELYLCALGINDEISLGTSYIGTINDIKNYASYSDYRDTFYGNYGKIIEQIKEHAPKSKIVLMSIAYLYNVTEDSFTAAIEEIAEHYGIPFINIKDDAFYAKDSIYKTGQSYNHPTAPLYAGMAKANERLFCHCVVDNYDYFNDFTTGQ